MEWTALEDEDGYRRLQIEAPWDEIAEEYRDLVTRYAATARLPGFRAGKTPRAEGGGLQRLKDMLLAESTLEYLVENQGSTTNKGA